MFSLSLADVPFVGSATPIQRAIAVLRKFGTDAHVWLPGVGALNGLQTANYLLSDASTGLAPVDQYVGRVSDALGGLGVELVPSLASATGWVITQPTSGLVLVSGGVITINSADGSLALAQAGATNAVIGKSYAYSVTVSTNTGAGIVVQIGNVSSATYTTPGTYSGVIVATAATGHLLKRSGGVTNTTATSFSVREVTGIDLTQATTASKPKLVRGAVNLLTYSNDFTNAAWGVTALGTGVTPIKTPNYGIAPDGTQTACRVQLNKGAGTTLTDLSEIYQGNVTPSATYSQTRAIWVKSLSGSPSVVITGGNGVTVTSEWQMLTRTTDTAERLRVMLRGTLGTSDTADLLIWTSGLFAGTLTAAKIQALGGIPLTTTAPASTALGPWAWQFDGSNDSLALSSVPFQMNDDHCVIAGVVGSKLQTTSVALSYTANSARYAAIGSSGSYPDFIEWYDGTTYKTLEGGVSVSDTRVISARRVGGTLTGRRNSLPLGPGSRPAFDTSVQGSTAAIGNGPLGNHLGGLGCVIAIKGTVSDSDLLLLEKLVGALSGVAIP